MYARFFTARSRCPRSRRPFRSDGTRRSVPGDLSADAGGDQRRPTAFYQSPHGVFRFGSQVFVLRGQTLTTYTVTDLGDMQIAREDFIGSLAARETKGGVAFSAGFLYISSEAGLEIYDLRNVRAGGTAPILVSRTPGLHYHRLAISGNTLAALYPGYRPALLGNCTLGRYRTASTRSTSTTSPTCWRRSASARSRRSSTRSAATTTSPSTSASSSPRPTAARSSRT